MESMGGKTEAKIAAQDAILDQLETHDPTRFDVEEQLTGDDKQTRLVGDDFPFDDSQLEAIHGLGEVQSGCLTGPAGTDQTTVLKKLVAVIKEGLSEISCVAYCQSTPARQRTGLRSRHYGASRIP